MKKPPRYSEENPFAVALNALSDWIWTNRIIENENITHTGDGILIRSSTTSTFTESYAFQPIPVPVPEGETIENAAFSLAVDKGHIVNIDGIPFAPSNLRAQIELPAETEGIKVYLDLTLDPDTSEILAGVVDWTDEEAIPTTPTGATGTSTGPVKAYKQLFTIDTTATGVNLGSVAEHSKTNFQLIRYAYESTCSNTSYAIAFLAS